MRRSVVLVACALAVAALVQMPARAQTEDSRPAANTVAGCLDRVGRLDLLFLVDESASLRGFGNTAGTDPDDRRVGAIKAALAGLARTADAPLDGRELRIDVKLVSFSAGYTPITPDWRRVGGDSLDDLLSVADRFAELDGGLDTDYGTALLRARDDLAQRSAAVTSDGSAAPCQAVVFFTDGKYDIGDRTGGARASLPSRVDYSDVALDRPGGGSQVVSDGREFLCEPGGLADQLRANGIVTFTVALDVGLDAGSRDFLDALTDGAGGTTTCGTTGSDETGLFVSAANADELLLVFGNLLGPPRQAVFCADEESCTFEVFEGLSGFSLLTSAPSDGLDVVLISPAGGSVRFTSGSPRSVAVDGVEIEQRQLSPRTFDVLGTLDGRAGVGTWRLQFSDPTGGVAAGGSFSIQYRAELLPDIGELQEVRRGETTTIPLRFVSPSGEEINGGPLLAGATIQATVVDPVTGAKVDLEVEQLEEGAYEADFAPPEVFESSTIRLDLTASVAPQEGIEIDVPARSIELTLLPPVTFPRIEPSSLQLPSVVDTGPSEGSLTVIGSDLSDGCVHFEPSALSLPGGESIPLRISPQTTEASCLSVPRGQSRVVEVDTRIDESSRGRASGELVAVLTGPTGEAPQRVVIPVRLDLDVSPSASVGWAVFAALMTLAVLLPLLVLHLLNYASALFRPAPQTVYLRSYPIRISDGQVVDVTTGQPPDTTYTEFRPARSGTSRPVRELDIGGATLRTRASFDRSLRRFGLFTGPFALVDANGRPVVAGHTATPLAASADDRTHEVPLALPGTWIFWQAYDETGESDGTLVLFIHHTAFESATSLLDRVNEQLPALAAALDERIGSRRLADSVSVEPAGADQGPSDSAPDDSPFRY